MWKLFIILLMLVPRIEAQASRPSSDDRGRILSLENAWNRAVQEKDSAALNMLLGPDLIYVDFDGVMMDKKTYVASVQSQTLHPEKIVSESMNVHLYGVVALVNGVYRENGAKNGKPYTLRERFTDTWLRQGESWVCVASHSTLTTQ